MKPRPFAQVDVFSSEPYLGNPVAVVLDAAGLTDDDLQRIARWTNLSETTFVLPPSPEASAEADYRVRIFTTEGELPFAGHPTLGTAHAWLEHGGTPRGMHGDGIIVQECAAGLVDVHFTPDAKITPDTPLSFVAPPTTRSGALSDAELDLVCTTLGISRDLVVDHQWVVNGPQWAAVMLPSAQDVLDITPGTFPADAGAATSAADLAIGAVGPYGDNGDSEAPADFEIRAFVPEAGVTEDPVTGSLNASVGQWLVRTGRVTGAYTVSQGTAIHRAGRILVTPTDDGDVLVGGVTRGLFRGTVLA